MEIVNVSGLKNNPSEALCMAHRDLVVVMNRDRPDALMVGIEAAGVLDASVAVLNLNAQEASDDIDTLERWLATT